MERFVAAVAAPLLLVAWSMSLAAGCGKSNDAAPAPDAGLAVEACKRACTTLSGCPGLPSASDCQSSKCVDPSLPNVCVSDGELANAWSQCASATCGSLAPCGDEPLKSARAHCLGRNDAGSGIYCGSTAQAATGDGCTLQASCEGKQYKMVCTGGTCTCTVDDAQTKTFPRLTGSCSEGENPGSDWATKCGFPYPS